MGDRTVRDGAVRLAVAAAALLATAATAQQTAKIMVAYEKLIVANKPACCLVEGDVNSTLACGLVGLVLSAQAAGAAPDEMLVSLDNFDRFFLVQHDVHGLASLAPLVAKLRPDVVLIDIRMPVLDGLSVTIRRASISASMLGSLGRDCQRTCSPDCA